VKDGRGACALETRGPLSVSAGPPRRLVVSLSRKLTRSGRVPARARAAIRGDEYRTEPRRFFLLGEPARPRSGGSSTDGPSGEREKERERERGSDGSAESNDESRAARCSRKLRMRLRCW